MRMIGGAMHGRAHSAFLVVAVMVAATGCGGGGDEVVAGPRATGTSPGASTPVSATTGPSATTAPAVSAGTEPASTEAPATEPRSSTSAPSTPGPAGVDIDPEHYVGAADLSELAALGQAVLLPTWVPAWAESAAPTIGLSSDATFFHMSFKLEVDHPYAEEIGQGTIILSFSRERRTPEHAPLAGDTITTAVRTYTVTDSAATCITGDVDPVPTILLWDDGEDRYAVAMQPNPACYPDDFSVAQAVAFADSLVACDPTGPTLECQPSPAP
jgi:hypothetical protein